MLKELLCKVAEIFSECKAKQQKDEQKPKQLKNCHCHDKITIERKRKLNCSFKPKFLNCSKTEHF